MKRVWDKYVSYGDLVDWESSEWHWVEDDSPTAMCDRWAQGQAKDAANTAEGTAATSGSKATTEHNALSPFYQEEMNAKHLYDPTQLNQILTSAGIGIGAASGAAAHDTDALAARTRNESGFTKSLQEQARDKMKAAAGVSQGVATQDVLGAKELNQAGAAGMSHLFDTDTNAQLQAMGLENQAINTEVEAGKSGWLQNLNSTMSAIGNLGKSVSGFKMPGK